MGRGYEDVKDDVHKGKTREGFYNDRPSSPEVGSIMIWNYC